MGLFGRRKDDTEQALEEAMLGSRAQARTVFEPQPLEDWEPASKEPASKEPASKKPASKKPASKKPASKKGGAKKSGPREPRYEVRPPEPGLSDGERRTALRAQMADLTRAYRDAPLDEMKGMIRQTLVAHGQDVPDAWVTTIAEGLRRNGPTPLNYDGVVWSKP